MLKIAQPGIPCPTCQTFIPMSLDSLLRADPFMCPNPTCGLVLNLQVAESKESLAVVKDLKEAIDQDAAGQ